MAAGQMKYMPMMAAETQLLGKKKLYHGDDFPKPFVVTRCAGILFSFVYLFVLISFATLFWAILEGMVLLLQHFDVVALSWWQLPAQLIAAAYCFLLVLLLFYRFAYSRWVYYFADCTFPRSDPRNITSKPAPLEKDLGRVEHPEHMRPTLMTRWDFIKCTFLIYPMIQLYRLFGPLTKNILFKCAYRKGKQGAKIEETLATLYLETICSLQYFKEIRVEAGRKFAVFSTEYFDPVLLPKVGGGLTPIKNFSIIIDLSLNAVVAASLDGDSLTLKKAWLISVYLFEWIGHAWLHAFCMWGADTENTDPWVSWMSQISLYFNHLGGDSGLGVLAMIAKLKDYFLSEDPNFKERDYANILPFQRPFRTYERISELAEYSRFISFILETRKIFMRLLAESDVEDVFRSMDPEAHFAIVVHSIDHWSFNQICDRWENMYHYMYDEPQAEAGIDYHVISSTTFLARALADDWPKIFDVFIRQAPLKFYQLFYEKARQVDTELAWNMQCCIVK